MTPQRAFAQQLSRAALHTTVGASELAYRQLREVPARSRAAAASVRRLPQAVRDRADEGIDVASAVEPYWPGAIRQTAACRLESARQRRNDVTEHGEAIVRSWQARRRRAA